MSPAGTRQVNDLLRAYAKAEERFRVIDSTTKYRSLVTASTTGDYPIQRWFYLKEAFGVDLLRTLLDDWHISARHVRFVLDPFCGSGTSILAVQRLAHTLGRDDLAISGFERNPFLRFVAETKSRWHTATPSKLRTQARHLLNGAPKIPPSDLPELSSLRRSEIFPRRRLEEILGFRTAIERIRGYERDILLLGYASAIESLSGTRKDGRALRIVPNKRVPRTDVAFRDAWQTMIDDIEEAGSFFRPVRTDVIIGDGRDLQPDNLDHSLATEFDIAFYSPPYLNNIDYTEVYKLELWLTGFVTSNQQFRELRYKTFRSHPSVKFRDPIASNHDKRLDVSSGLIKTLLAAIPEDEDKVWRARLFQEYFDDMYRALVSQKRALRRGGWAFCVVGNALHGPGHDGALRVPIASDILISVIAEEIGLRVEGIQVARKLMRRPPDTHLLRESVVVLRKP